MTSTPHLFYITWEYPKISTSCEKLVYKHEIKVSTSSCESHSFLQFEGLSLSISNENKVIQLCMNNISVSCISKSSPFEKLNTRSYFEIMESNSSGLLQNAL